MGLRRIDLLVAEKVEGIDPTKAWTIERYSADMAVAWPIAERLRLSVSPHGESMWAAGQPRPSETEPNVIETDQQIAGTAPLAICLAALRLAGMSLRALGDLVGEANAG